MDEAKEIERFEAIYGEAPDGVQYPMKRIIYDAHKHGFLTARKLDRAEGLEEVVRRAINRLDDKDMDYYSCEALANLLRRALAEQEDPNDAQD